jgi:putative transcriptional regulator
MIQNNLSKLLGERKMKISELARLINYDYSAVSRFYHDKTEYLNLDMLDKICWALQITPGELFNYFE